MEAEHSDTREGAVSAVTSEFNKEVLGRLKPFGTPSNAVAYGELSLSIIAVFTLTLVDYFVLAAKSNLAPILLIPCWGLTGLLIVKLFTIQHDCGHGSFFSSPHANMIVGRFCSLFTFIPYTAWRREHAEHHAVFSNIDNQTFGDILVLSASRYRQLPETKKLLYRIFRSPIFLLVLAPLLYIVVRQRIPSKATKQRILSCFSHTGSLLLAYGYASYALGFGVVISIILPSLYVAAATGVLIFSIEHQFERSEWRRGSEWDFINACINGSSFFILPFPFEWLTGNIGYHHLHHLQPKIPSYRLKKSFLETQEFILGRRVTWKDWIASLNLGLYDDESGRLVTIKKALE